MLVAAFGREQLQEITGRSSSDSAKITSDLGPSVFRHVERCHECFACGATVPFVDAAYTDGEI